MPIFSPTGSLNISADATELGDGDLVRAKNVRLDRPGLAVTRPGSSRSTNKLGTVANFMIEQSGDRYEFAGTGIFQNELNIASGLTDADWSAYKYNAFNETVEMVFALNGTDRKRITGTTVNEWGITAPSAAPTLGVGAGTGLTGAYNAKYTYLRKSGSTIISESNPSDAASSAQTLANEDLEITWTASGDPQVTHVRLYRTLPGGAIYFVDQDVAIGAVTVDSSTADVSLGAEVATNHDRPPLGTVVAGPFYNGTSFILKDNLLYFSLAKQPEYWPATNFIEVGPPQFPGKAIVEFGGQPYVLTEDRIWFIQGTSANTFNAIPMRSLAGASNQFGAVSIDGDGLYHIGGDGVYRYSGGKDTKITGGTFDPIFPTSDAIGDITNGIDAVTNIDTAWLHQFGNKLYFHYGNGAVLVRNLDDQRAGHYKWDQRMMAPMTDQTNKRFYTSDAGSFTRQVEDKSQTTDAGTGIGCEVESKEFTLPTRAHFPRWLKYDADLSAATSGKGELLLDGAVHHTHTVTGNRETKRRLVDTGNGAKASVRISWTGAGTVYTAEWE